jgi:hypothetical protein
MYSEEDMLVWGVDTVYMMYKLLRKREWNSLSGHSIVEHVDKEC